MAVRLTKIDGFLLCIAALSIGTLFFLSETRPTEALTSGSYVTAALGAIIELDVAPVDPINNDPAHISASMTEDNGYATGGETLTVSSNNPTGYSVTLKMANDDKNMNYLVSSDVSNYTDNGTVLDTTKNVIAPTTQASLTPSTWGFYLDDREDYYRAVPLNTATGINIIAEATTPNQGRSAGTDTLIITYGVMIDWLLPANTSYTNRVLYTATNNPA